jgi:hypothetical protein
MHFLKPFNLSLGASVERSDEEADVDADQARLRYLQVVLIA